MECAKHQRRNRHATIASIRVQDGIIMTDPENPSRPHSCAGPIRNCVVNAQQLVQEKKKDLRKSGMRPSKAYIQLEADVARMHPANHIERQDLQDEVGQNHQFKKHKTSFYRARRHKIPVINTLDAIPDSLKMTIQGAASTDVNDPAYHEMLLIYEDTQAPFFIFASRMGLETLHQSSHLICDGTFKSFPPQFSQKYTIHGFVNGESQPIIINLMNIGITNYLDRVQYMLN